MIISQTAEYAIRAIVFLAEYAHQDGANGSYTIQQIARTTRIPSGYLSKVMQSLARRGIVSSQRGLGGGFTLVQDPKTLSVYEIVDCVDPIRIITKCPLGLPAHSKQLCEMHSRLNALSRHTEIMFRETTVEDLVQRPTFLTSENEIGLGVELAVAAT